MDILTEIVNFIFNFIIGVMMMHVIFMLINRRKHEDEVEQEKDERLKTVISALSSSKPVYIEKHSDQYLMFDSLKNTFLCQSSSLDGLAETCHKYAKIDLAIVKFEHDFFLFRKGKVIREGEEMEIKV